MLQARRDFLRQVSVGLAAGGTAGWTLHASAAPTLATPDAHQFVALLAAEGDPAATDVELLPAKAPAEFRVTEDNILGPFFRPGAPYRGKVTPPLEPGDVIVVRGRVWGIDTKKPLDSALLHVWQASAAGRYDNDDAEHPPRPGIFRNRIRLRTDETGYYEYETVRPGAYKIGPESWRPSHIHYLVAAPGYKRLITQLYFSGDPHNATDDFIKDSLVVDLSTIKTDRGSFQLATFDIVLEKA
jgi:catechol 1,2-dioxygenase